MNRKQYTMRIEHIGIAVKDLETAIKTYESLMDTPCYKREVVDSQSVETAFFRAGRSKIELLGSTRAESVIGRYLEKHGEGIHHIAFEVKDIAGSLKRLKARGFTLLNEEPVDGADNMKVAFVHPKDNHGVLVELCQARG